MANVSSELQASITTLEQKHTALIQAVQSYSGGSVANNVNELVEKAAALKASLQAQESAVMAMYLANYEGPVPSMILDFQRDVYLRGTRRPENSYWVSDLGTFTSNSPTTVVDGGGVVRVRDADAVPIAFSPVNGEARGLQRDPESTNLVPSSIVNLADWGTLEATLQFGKPSPDGLYEAVKVIPDNGSAQGQGRTSTSYNIPVVEGRTYTASSFVKADGVTALELKSWGNGWHYQFIVNLTTGAVSNGTLGTDPSTDRAFAEKYPNGWWRVTTTFVAKQGDYVTLQHCSRNGGENNGSNGFHVWGVQLEEHNTSTSYIPTAGSPVTRQMEHTYFSLGDMYNQATGKCSIVVDFWYDPVNMSQALEGGNCILFGLTSDNGIYTPQRKAVALTSEGKLAIFWSTNTFAFPTQPTQAGWQKVAITIGDSRSYWYLNGEQHPSWKDRLDTGPQRINIMSDRPGNTALDSPTTFIRSIKYYPFELSKAEAEDLTS